jgi:hypothetical protein
VLRDRFDHVESISGYVFDDILEGDNRGHFIPETVTTGRPPTRCSNSTS